MIKFVKILLLRSGTVTIRYPYGTPLVTTAFCGAIGVVSQKYTSCDACTRICPSGALSIINEGNASIHKGIRYFVGRGIFCGMCADTCLERAVNIAKEFELASDEVSELYNDVEYEPCKCRRCGTVFASRKLLGKIESMR